MEIWTKYNFFACRRVRPELWDYAGERLPEGPMERVEQHLEACANCRKEVGDLKRAQTLLAAAQVETPPAPRLGWGDLQQRIAADVAAYGPPRPDKAATRQAVSQLVPTQCPSRMTTLRPMLASGLAMGLAFALFVHSGKMRPESVPVSVSRSVSASPPALAMSEPTPGTFGLVDTADDSFGSSALTEASPAPRTTEKTPALRTAKPASVNERAFAAKRVTKASMRKSVKIVPKAEKPETRIADAPKNAGKIEFTPHNPTAGEQAPDAADVPHGVIGVLVPVSHDDDNVYY